MNPNRPFDFLMAPENEPADARQIREAFLDRLGPLNPVQAFYFNYLVRGVTTTIRAEIVETLELTRAVQAIQKKIEGASEPLETNIVFALAMRDMSRNDDRLQSLLRSQNRGSRECQISLRDIAAAGGPFPPPDMPSCMQDIVEDTGVQPVAPPILKAA
jgi:hypothetical protein